ncbi:MAG TPA: metallophosphoesterase family protein [Thermohalobaculum sp.]|nr:metallophosphoesterase family protein [Thermohalobaculum sp.]
MVMLPEARAPEGMRLYVIGDVHGRRDLLVKIHRRIARDIERRPARDCRVIHLGDYIDRGPDSAGVLEVLARYAADERALFLRGNHDQFLINFMGGVTAEFDVWMGNGGIKTLDSFGLDGFGATYGYDDGSLAVLRQTLEQAIPADVMGFLDRLDLMHRFGDYVFVHAGVRPGVALDDQEPSDLIWMREPFLSDDSDHGAVIVHGHTPTDVVEMYPNRISVDTGAVFTGVLSCLVLEGTDRFLLEDGWLQPLKL